MRSRLVYRLIHDELELNSKPSLNLATFVTTWMEAEARQLAEESIDVNLVDHSIYPMTTEIQKRIVAIAANLLHAEYDPYEERDEYIGTATVGSSEAVMLGILAHKIRWLEWYDRLPDEKKPADGRVPNMVIGGAYQVCWEKVYKFFDIAGLDGYKDENDHDPPRCGLDRYDPQQPPRERCRVIPLEEGQRVITADVVRRCIERGIIDENTCALGLLLGNTLTGEMDEVEEINEVIREFNDQRDEQAKKNGGSAYRLPIHVDAAYGGLVFSFSEPDTCWDFRLSEVQSINISNHKTGLVYAGLGTVVFKNTKVVPDGLFTSVNYLGSVIHDYALNFSRASSQVICQYYNFLRLGRSGYTAIMERILSVASYVAGQLLALNSEGKPYFELLTTHRKDEEDELRLRLPNLVVRLLDDVPFSANALSNRLSQDGWTVPAYTLPRNLDDVWVLRMVIKENFSMDMAELFLGSMDRAIADLKGPAKSTEHIPRRDGYNLVC